MRVHQVLLTGIVCAGIAALVGAGVAAQTPARGRGAVQGAGTRVHGTLLQVMRGILYPASNVIFAAQSEDPAAIKPATDASTSPYKAAQAKNQDAILEAAGVVSEACSHCHDKYREVPNRC